MLTKLEKFKKLFSTAFLIISALVLLPVIFYVKNDIIQVFAAIMLFVHFVIAVIYFIKGIPVAAMCTVYYLLLCIGIAIALLFNRYIKLPSFLDSNISNSIGIIITVVFTVVIPLPNLIKEWIANKLDDTKNNITSDEMIAKDSDTQSRDINGVDYAAFIEYSGTMKYNEASYSMANASPSLRTIRLIIGILFIVVGAVGLLIGTNIVDSSTTFLHSWAFWITACSLALFASGATILVAGFIRGFVCIIALGILGVLGYYGYVMLRNTLKISILLHCLMAVLLIAFAVLGFWQFLKFISRKQRKTLTIYEENDCIYAVDLFLKDYYPIIDYYHFACINIFFNENVDLKDLDNFNDDLLLYCGNRKMIFAGAILDKQKQTYTIYIYFSTQKHEKKIRGYFRRKYKLQIKINFENDVHWDTYKMVLLPRDITFIKICNQKIINELEEGKFDFSIEVPVIFSALFEEKENALKFKENVEKQSYEKVVYVDNSEYAKENSLIKKYYHQVLVQKNMKISEAWLNIETLKFHELAKDTGGEYGLTYFGELDEIYEDEDDSHKCTSE